MKFAELDIVEIAEDTRVVDAYSADGSQVSLSAGARGTVVNAFSDPGEAYEVEFINRDGETLAIATLLPEQLRQPAA